MNILQEFKLMSRIDFRYGYKNLQAEEMFIDLPPQLKQKIEKLITKE